MEVPSVIDAEMLAVIEPLQIDALQLIGQNDEPRLLTCGVLFQKAFVIPWRLRMEAQDDIE